MNNDNPPQTQKTGAPGRPEDDTPDADDFNPNESGLAEESLAAAELNAQLQTALDELAQTKDALLRALADVENIRKRSATELSNAHKYAIEGFAANLLPVKDTLEMALADKTSTTEQMRMGVDLTLKNLATSFEKARVKEVNPLHQKFDPTLHQAVSQVESDQPAGTVAQVFQKGYVLADRVLRPAMVAVSKGPSETARQGEKPVESQGN